MRVQVTLVNPEVNNNTLYVEYERIGNEFIMRRWRIGFDVTPDPVYYPKGRLEGDWHKIHGNQKQPIGHMPIRTRMLSAYCRSKYKTVEVIGKA